MKTPNVYINDLNTSKLSYINYLCKGASNKSNIDKMRKVLSKAIIDELTEKQRFCIIEHCLNEKKEKDIAYELGVNPSTVSRHISSAKKRLQNIASYYF